MTNETAIEALIKEVTTSSKAESLLDLARGFTEHDFASLALLAADQAGASLHEQGKIEAVLGEALDRCQCSSCCRSQGDF